MLQAKPPISVTDQPNLGITFLGIDQKRPGLDDVAMRLDAIRDEIRGLRTDLTHRTWGYRWYQFTVLCRHWWLRVRGVFDGS